MKEKMSKFEQEMSDIRILSNRAQIVISQLRNLKERERK